LFFPAQLNPEVCRLLQDNILQGDEIVTGIITVFIVTQIMYMCHNLCKEHWQ